MKKSHTDEIAIASSINTIEGEASEAQAKEEVNTAEPANAKKVFEKLLGKAEGGVARGTP